MNNSGLSELEFWAMAGASVEEVKAEASGPDTTYQESQGQQQQQCGPCHCEMKQFGDCALNQGDFQFCEGFRELPKQRSFANGLI